MKKPNRTMQSMVIETIRTKLFEPEDRRLDRMLQALNQKNKFKQRLTFDGFLYNGEYELPKHQANRLPNKGDLKGLNLELFDEMELLIKARRESELNISFCTQILYGILAPCITMPDVRDALPDHLWKLYGSTHHYERQRPELWTIENNPTLKRQYEKFEEILAILMIGQMMY